MKPRVLPAAQAPSHRAPSIASTVALAGLSVAVLGITTFAEQAGLLWPASPIYFSNLLRGA
jgi:hypothetical protein